MLNRRKGLYALIILIIGFIVTFSACVIPNNFHNFSNHLLPATTSGPVNKNPHIELIFNAEIPSGSSNRKVFLDILDELTGLSLNPYRYEMAMIDSTHFLADISVSKNSIIKYRYLIDGTPPSIECAPSGKSVRYRLFFADVPGEIKDIVAGWNKDLATKKTGRIQGKVSDSKNSPVSNLLIAVGGIQTRTSATGDFLVEGLPEGIHNLVAFSTEGIYKPFQQGVMIFLNSTTPVNFKVDNQNQVMINFVATPFESNNNLGGMDLFLIGDYYGLGNTYADLEGGINTLTLQAVKMKEEPDGSYTAAIRVPENQIFRYKYSLGDGFWNSEQFDSKFLIREIFPSGTNQTINDRLNEWSSPGLGEISFNLLVPSDTPKDDVIYIQFNPYDWTVPLPMIRTGEDQWKFTLFSPLQNVGVISYRYCRNGQCLTTDENSGGGITNSVQKFSPSPAPQVINDKIISWNFQDQWDFYSPDITDKAVPRNSYFWVGVGIEFLSNYHPLKNLGANRVILTPTWTASNWHLPVIEPIPGIIH